MRALKELIPKMRPQPSFLSEDEFIAFLSICRGKQNARKTADKFTKNIGALIVQLSEAIIQCSDFNLSRRLQRAHDALIPQNDHVTVTDV